MRLVIDLQSCQNGAAADPQAVLALAQALVRGAGDHTVVIALAERYPDAADALRAAFAGLLAPERIVSYLTPAGGTPWQQPAAELIRDAFFAMQQADVVLAPGLFDRPLHETICGKGPDGVLLAYSVDYAEAPQGALALHQQWLMRHAAVVLSGDAASAQALADLPPLAGTADADADAALLWRAFEQALAARPAPTPAAGKPRLAYISPLPPEHSGIADYSAEVIAELDPYYEIELVTGAGRARPGADGALAAAHARLLRAACRQLRPCALPLRQFQRAPVYVRAAQAASRRGGAARLLPQRRDRQYGARRRAAAGLPAGAVRIARLHRAAAERRERARPGDLDLPVQQGGARPCRRHHRPFRFFAPAGRAMVRPRQRRCLARAAAPARPAGQPHAGAAPQRGARRARPGRRQLPGDQLRGARHHQAEPAFAERLPGLAAGARSALPAGVRR